MDKRLTFNEDPKNYDALRPQYTDALYRAIFTYSGVQAGDDVVEIGSGTGQATAPFLQHGCNVTAVELGADLAAYSKEKFAAHTNFHVENMAFEQFTRPAASIDLVYSATAFHWVPESIGYAKVFSLLKPGGTIALFWNRPNASREDDALHMAIQQIYDAHPYARHFKNNTAFATEEDRYRAIRNRIIYYGFKRVECHLYHTTRQFSAAEYTALLDTYSDHRNLPQDVRTAFYADIKNAIDAYGGTMTIYDTMDLYLGTRP